MIMNKEKNFVSVVTYLYNDEKNVVNYLEKMNDFLENNFEHYEIIFVNDGSTDNSVKLIKEKSKYINGSVVSIVNMSYHQGIELAMNAGIDLSIGDFVFEFDTTYIDYDMVLIMDVYKKCLEGNDIVSASPNKKLRFTSKVFYKLFNNYNNSKNKLSTETFQVISRRAINRVNDVNKTIPYRKAVYVNCGLKKAVINYTPNIKKKKDLEKKDNKYRQELATNSIILFTNAVYKLSISMVVAMILVLLAIVIYTIVVFVGNNPIAGWTTLMLLISFAFLGVFMILAVIIRYLSILMELIFKKQNYLVESIEKITK